MTDDSIDVDAVDELDELTDIDSETVRDADSLDLEQLGPLVERATELLESATDGDEDSSAGKLQALLHLTTLIQGVLETTDVDELLATVDFEEADSLVDVDSLDNALESGNLGEAVELQNLRRLIEFGQLWDAVDLTELMDSKDEITETVGQLTDDDDDAGGLLDSELLDDMEMEDFTGDDDGVSDGLTDPEMIQAATQAQLDDAIDGFRDLLVETHARLNELREMNETRFEGVDQPSSRNPTAVSTLSTHGGPPKVGSTASTVPRNVRHSTGPSRQRIYGRRFEKLMEETQDDEPAETDDSVDQGGDTQ